jgi:hypothetical protein
MANKTRQASNSAPDENAFVPKTPEHLQKFLNLDKVKDAFARKMGLAFLAWTSCCETVSIIFDILTGLDEEISEVIFKSIRNDRTQRELTLEVARIKLKEHPDIFRELQEALRQLGELASERNSIAHYSFGLHVDKDWNAEMKPMSDNHAWATNAENRLDALVQNLDQKGTLLFDIFLKLSEELRQVDGQNGSE